MFVPEKKYFKKYNMGTWFSIFHFSNNFSLKYKNFKKNKFLIYSKYSDQILLSNTAKNDLKKYATKQQALVSSFCFQSRKKWIDQYQEKF